MPTPRRPKAPILIVEDKDSLRAMLRHALGEQATACRGADEAEALRRSATRGPTWCSDRRLPSGDGVGVLAARKIDPELPVIVMTAYGSIRDAVVAMKEARSTSGQAGRS
jgi:DNA-binding NtrC family response regulator